MHNNRAASWELDTDFIGPMDKVHGALCVRVNVLKLEIPKYSFVLGYIPPSKDASDFKVFFQQDHDITGQLSVIFDAVDYIKRKIIEDNAVRIEKLEKQRADEGEAAAERDRKKKHYEDNVRRKKDSDRARTAAGKKGNKEVIT